MAGLVPIGAELSSGACRHARPRHGHPRRETAAKLAKMASYLNVYGRDEHGHDGKGGWEPRKEINLAPIGLVPAITSIRSDASAEGAAVARSTAQTFGCRRQII